MLKGNAYCLIDEATKAVLRVSWEPPTVPDGCIVRSVRGEQLPPEVKALAKTSTHYDIEAVFIGAGKAAFLADDPTSIRIEVRESEGGAAEERYAQMLARRFEAMEPTGVVDAAILGLVRLAGPSAVARAAVGVGSGPAPAPKPVVRKTRKKVK